MVTTIGTGSEAAAATSIGRAIDRARYRAQQWGLIVPLAAGHRLMALLKEGRTPEPPRDAVRAVQRRYRELLEEDLANVERGLYPRELLFQLPVARYLRLLPRAVAEIPRVIRRRWRNDHQDLPGGVDLERFPRYFRRTFHWQTDGYLSEHSARIYDASVEFLFGGTADVMRRMAIPPLLRGPFSERPRILDLGCGTGRFLLQLATARPDARLYALDLSPWYLKEAERNLAGVPDVAFLAENAEDVPLKDGAVDACVSVFVFHELPPSARRNVVREALRVLRPGGRFVIVDSAQLAESGEIEVFLHRFAEQYHEPYYEHYLKDDLAGLLAECGFEVEETRPVFLSRLVVGRKPG